MSITRRMAMSGALAVLAAGLVTSAGTGAQAATSAFTTRSAHAASAGGGCVYFVRYNHTPVQENPDTDSIARKYKPAGARVTGPCRAAYDTESRVWFTAVDCSCTTDGIGWIRSYWLS
ncbi:hypothetical protein ACIBKY_44090 [Nonomuraea sp. NPDC050394]|uniref:hypothetical protein n=1 Tax=Nonomuraea sp. NPDC050394 TaxID=3364363 RepID=UPI00378A4BF5